MDWWVGACAFHNHGDVGIVSSGELFLNVDGPPDETLMVMFCLGPQFIHNAQVPVAETIAIAQLLRSRTQEKGRIVGPVGEEELLLPPRLHLSSKKGVGWS